MEPHPGSMRALNAAQLEVVVIRQSVLLHVIYWNTIIGHLLIHECSVFVSLAQNEYVH